MEESLFPDKPTGKLFTANAVRIATFLGGPLVTGYLFAENYKQLGEFRKAESAWLVAIVSTIIIFVIAWFLPANFPPYIIPIAYTLAAYETAKKIFNEKIKTHTTAGGQTWPIGRAVVAGFIGLIIIVALVFGYFLITDRYF